MVDHHSRNIICTALKRAAQGRIDSAECENRFLDLNSTDVIIDALYRTIRYINDGDDEESLKRAFPLGSEARKRLARWLLFLQRGLEYEWPPETLPSGILDLYIPTTCDRISGNAVKLRKRIHTFMSHGDYNVWPFLTASDMIS